MTNSGVSGDQPCRTLLPEMDYYSPKFDRYLLLGALRPTLWIGVFKTYSLRPCLTVA